RGRLPPGSRDAGHSGRGGAGRSRTLGYDLEAPALLTAGDAESVVTRRQRAGRQHERIVALRHGKPARLPDDLPGFDGDLGAAVPGGPILSRRQEESDVLVAVQGPLFRGLSRSHDVTGAQVDYGAGMRPGQDLALLLELGDLGLGVRGLLL